MSTAVEAPATIGGVTVDWIDALALDLHRQGLAFRGSERGPWIEVQNLDSGRFEPLTLESRRNGDCAFETTLARDLVLAALEYKVRRHTRR